MIFYNSKVMDQELTEYSIRRVFARFQTCWITDLTGQTSQLKTRPFDLVTPRVRFQNTGDR
ncbi:hypothetical protein Pint_19380 [Pistacia integerrima]|uniref:Uncharacterized protein n=1 Tax=Pistacia integerrima TaxID=434235 RepID=A0ACC0Z0D6_9ROSI|nr:hypothetical protein Pint_19380 [Pistacia integerrima]